MSSILFARAAKRITIWIGSSKRHLSSASHGRTAFIALGSNEGNPIKNIENACRELDKAGLRVSRTSHLYETEPMYYHDQAKFINGACEVVVEDDLSPLDLLAKLKHIEKSLGRQKLIDKGPRNIDLDILLYNDKIWESDDLSIPHKSMLEREFVLRPLCDLIPGASHPQFKEQTYLDHLKDVKSDGPAMSSVTAVGDDRLLKPMDPLRETLIMSIVNVTPDSFSDGGIHTDPAFTLQIVRDHVDQGASIIDIGGFSTRPGAAEISAQEEIDRVIPMIQAVAKLRQEHPHLNISVDTFRHDVAEEAINNGADIVNDVSAGLLDSKMLQTVARLGCTYIAMHMRGNPKIMNGLTDYKHSVVDGVARELLERLEAAEEAGIRRWRLILDPGIGFAKNASQNLELLRDHERIRQWPGLKGFPWLIGTSRKRFIGQITKVNNPGERVWGTAAAVTASVQAGADVVRVHDVKEMSQVVKMADAIWRVEKSSYNHR